MTDKTLQAMKDALEALALFASDESPEGYMAITAFTNIRAAIKAYEEQEPMKQTTCGEINALLQHMFGCQEREDVTDECSDYLQYAIKEVTEVLTSRFQQIPAIPEGMCLVNKRVLQDALNRLPLPDSAIYLNEMLAACLREELCGIPDLMRGAAPDMEPVASMKIREDGYKCLAANQIREWIPLYTAAQLAQVEKERDEESRQADYWANAHGEMMEKLATVTAERDALKKDAAYGAQAKRLALELECLLMDTKDTAVVSKWWDSGMEALEDYRAIDAAMREGE